jgi:hypothetical protein
LTFNGLHSFASQKELLIILFGMNLNILRNDVVKPEMLHKRFNSHWNQAGLLSWSGFFVYVRSGPQPCIVLTRYMNLRCYCPSSCLNYT